MADGVGGLPAASAYRPAAVRLVDYGPRWPRRYADEARLLTDTLGSIVLVIEHIGSTSIPGMPAKPVIDILVAVRGDDGPRPLVARLDEVGYLYSPKPRPTTRAARSSGRDRTT